MMPSSRRFSVEKAMRVREAGDGRVQRDTFLPCSVDVAGVGPVGAVEQAGELGAARAEEARRIRRPRRGADVEVGGLDRALAAEAGRAANSGVSRASRALDRPVGARPIEESVEVLADHLRDELRAGRDLG